MENVPLRAVARDSGVIASDDFVSPIGVYADCGRLGDTALEGEALVAFTVFAPTNRNGGTEHPVHAQDRPLLDYDGLLRILTDQPLLPGVSTRRLEAHIR